MRKEVTRRGIRFFIILRGQGLGRTVDFFPPAKGLDPTLRIDTRLNKADTIGTVMRRKIRGGRKPVQRSLPPLAETCAAFKGFRQEATRLDQVYELLAAIIQRYRRTTPVVFYSLREATVFF